MAPTRARGRRRGRRDGRAAAHARRCRCGRQQPRVGVVRPRLRRGRRVRTAVSTTRFGERQPASTSRRTSMAGEARERERVNDDRGRERAADRLPASRGRRRRASEAPAVTGESGPSRSGMSTSSPCPRPKRQRPDESSGRRRSIREAIRSAHRHLAQQPPRHPVVAADQAFARSMYIVLPSDPSVIASLSVGSFGVVGVDVDELHADRALLREMLGDRISAVRRRSCARTEREVADVDVRGEARQALVLGRQRPGVAQQVELGGDRRDDPLALRQVVIPALDARASRSRRSCP